MDQNTILTGLKHALEHGSGSLDDLSDLLNRAQADITLAKKEQADAERKAKEAETLKRGKAITAMANRMLEGKPTADDVALVLGAYMKNEGINTEVTAESVTESIKNSRELSESLEELADVIADLFETFAGAIKSNENEKPIKKIQVPANSKKKDADAALDSFLHDLGLR